MNQAGDSRRIMDLSDVLMPVEPAKYIAGKQRFRNYPAASPAHSAKANSGKKGFNIIYLF
jgi:hypothetical protein